MKHPRSSDERGFALALVVLLLFAVGILGATGYQLAQVNSAMAVQGNEGHQALIIARAGLQEYLATQIGVPADTATYSIEGGDAIVTSRQVVQLSDTTSLWVIKSEGVYLDPASTASAARRVVYQYADHRDVGMDFEAALVMADGNLTVSGSAASNTVDGDDDSSSGACSQAVMNLPGVLLGSGSASWSGSDVRGSPDTLREGSYNDVIAELGLSWDVLTDPNFTPDFEDRWPSGIPNDSFPVVRFNGNRTGYAWSTSDARGVLIVDGTLRPRYGFYWEGIVLARSIDPRTSGWYFSQQYGFQGMVVTGMDGTNHNLTVTQYGSYQFDRCDAYQAARSLGYFRPIADAWWEGG